MRTVSLTLFLMICTLAQSQDGSGKFASREPRYRLEPNDVVELQYRYTPEYNQTVNVQPDGFVTLQLLGDVKLGGLTLTEGRAAVLDRARTRLRDPEITLLLKEFEKPHFVVGGEVNSPGRFELRGNITVNEAIAMAGGLKAASAKHSQVLLVRRVNETFADARVLDLKEILRTKAFAEDQTLRAGDMVIVPQNVISKIERFVKWVNIGVYANPTLR